MDRYTKVVLTVIALALVALVAKSFVRPECGSFKKPCWVAADQPLHVTSGLWPLQVSSGPVPLYVQIIREHSD